MQINPESFYSNRNLAKYGLSDDIAEEVRNLRAAKGDGMVDILTQHKGIAETDLLHAMEEEFHIPYLPELPMNNLDIDFTKHISIQFLKKYRMVPLVSTEGPVIAVNDPSNFQAFDDLKRILNVGGARMVLATRTAILSAINVAYDMGHDSEDEFIHDMNGESPDSIISEIEETADLLDDTSSAPVIKLVNLMLSRAVKARASDIHIEPFQKSLIVRYRIDGVLYNIMDVPKGIQSSLASRIKIMAKLNIAEKRLPQDGRIDIKIGDKLIDIRVSIIPTAFGERIVLRLLDKTGIILKMTDLGIDDNRLKQLNTVIHSPHGIILVTGPTGSGKTTTLYAVLSTLNNPDVNIITIEDPIEYQIDGIGQIQVNPKIDLTFARGLRSIVRQDPDVILVGEIRDGETAEIAIQSSLTGHLVFSTLHTNDAASSITRLIDMGMEPFLVSSSLVAVIAQRLIRLLCPECRERYVPDHESLAKVGIDSQMLQDRTIYRSTGCSACMKTGYRGRTAIFEMMLLNDDLKKLILKTSDANEIKQEAVKHGMKTLLQDGATKVLEGKTSIEEIYRVTGF
ncbi:MAG TPA: type II secretion system protein GspE [Deltaproteobacteria bacterium]|nr:type II secretion system protein GspE [Deltaproteobacteria bacterium]